MLHRLIITDRPKIILHTKDIPEKIDPYNLPDTEEVKELTEEEKSNLINIQINMVHFQMVDEFIQIISKKELKEHLGIMWAVLEEIGKTDIIQYIKDKRFSKLKKYIDTGSFAKDIYDNSQLLYVNENVVPFYAKASK